MKLSPFFKNREEDNESKEKEEYKVIKKTIREFLQTRQEYYNICDNLKSIGEIENEEQFLEYKKLKQQKVELKKILDSLQRKVENTLEKNYNNFKFTVDNHKVSYDSVLECVSVYKI